MYSYISCLNVFQWIALTVAHYQLDWQTNIETRQISRVMSLVGSYLSSSSTGEHWAVTQLIRKQKERERERQKTASNVIQSIVNMMQQKSSLHACMHACVSLSSSIIVRSFYSSFDASHLRIYRRLLLLLYWHNLAKPDCAAGISVIRCPSTQPMQKAKMLLLYPN